MSSVASINARLVAKAHGRLTALGHARRESGLSQGELDLLVYFSKAPSSSGIEAADHTGINRATVRRYLSRLRRAGFLVRGVHEENLHRVEFSLSSSGEKVVAALCAAVVG